MASSFVVFLDAGSLILSFYRPFIFMFSVFSAAFGSLVLSVLFTINNHHCSAGKQHRVHWA